MADEMLSHGLPETVTECSFLPSNYVDSLAIPTDIPQCAVTFMFAKGKLKGVKGR